MTELTLPSMPLAGGDDLSEDGGIPRPASSPARIRAGDDHEAILAWLASLEIANTLANGRKEAERLLLWALEEPGRSLSSLTQQDLLAYQRFLADPQPAERWIMAAGRKLPRAHPDWRPFAGPLSESSRRQSMSTLNTMFSWLVRAGYLESSPLAPGRRPRRSVPRPFVERVPENALWEEVRATVASMPRATLREESAYARTRWLISLLYLCGPSTSEVANNTMGAFFCRTSRRGEVQWWLPLKGKAGKLRLVPATAELMEELGRYRASLGLPATPQRGEAAPLVFPVWWRLPPAPVDWPAPLTRTALYGLVKWVFVQTSVRLASLGQSALAARIRGASAQWLRQTSGAHQGHSLDLQPLHDILGQAALSPSLMVLCAEDEAQADARHEAISANHSLRWELA